MAETKRITSLYVVTDSETHYDKCGNIQGGLFDEGWLKEHIKTFGIDGLLQKISWMHYQIYQAYKDINEELDAGIGIQIPNENKNSQGISIQGIMVMGNNSVMTNGEWNLKGNYTKN